MLLVHICCAPCLTYPHEWLQERKVKFKGLFFNPNIHPFQEFRKRAETLEEYSAKLGIDIAYEKRYGLLDFLHSTVGREKERCLFCYESRLRRAASEAKAQGFSAFTSTLLVSPYQKHDLIKSTAERVAQEEGIEFFYVDWRDGYRQGVQRSLDLGLYRQRYCGCIYSEAEREGAL